MLNEFKLQDILNTKPIDVGGKTKGYSPFDINLSIYDRPRPTYSLLDLVRDYQLSNKQKPENYYAQELEQHLYNDNDTNLPVPKRSAYSLVDLLKDRNVNGFDFEKGAVSGEYKADRVNLSDWLSRGNDSDFSNKGDGDMVNAAMGRENDLQSYSVPRRPLQKKQLMQNNPYQNTFNASLLENFTRRTNPVNVGRTLNYQKTLKGNSDLQNRNLVAKGNYKLTPVDIDDELFSGYDSFPVFPLAPKGTQDYYFSRAGKKAYHMVAAEWYDWLPTTATIITVTYDPLLLPYYNRVKPVIAAICEVEKNMHLNWEGVEQGKYTYNDAIKQSLIPLGLEIGPADYSAKYISGLLIRKYGLPESSRPVLEDILSKIMVNIAENASNR